MYVTFLVDIFLFPLLFIREINLFLQTVSDLHLENRKCEKKYKIENFASL